MIIEILPIINKCKFYLYYKKINKYKFKVYYINIKNISKLSITNKNKR